MKRKREREVEKEEEDEKKKICPLSFFTASLEAAERETPPPIPFLGNEITLGDRSFTSFLFSLGSPPGQKKK